MKEVIRVGKPWEQSVEFSLGVVSSGRFLHTSGITARDPEGKIVGVGDIEKQIEQCFSNLLDVLKAAKCDWGDVVKFTLYTTDMDAFVQHRPIWGSYFIDKPASTLIGVNRLIDPQMMVEIEAVVRLPDTEL
jgi:2-iminobutanoate/2-iminopropanoate deaminase